jgi:arsenate reductase-like glutaredoxin family protein
MVEEPNLIRRPLLVVDGQIITGFDRKTRAQLSDVLGKRLE